MSLVYKSLQASSTTDQTLSLYTCAVTSTIVKSVMIHNSSASTRDVIIKLQKDGSSSQIVVFQEKAIAADGAAQALSESIVMQNGDILHAECSGADVDITLMYVENTASIVGISVKELSDWSITTPTTGQVAIYNATTGLWTPGAVNIANSEIDDLSDVSAGSPTSGDVLVWNGSLWTTSQTLQNLIDIVKKPDADSVSLEKDANNKIVVDGTSGSENIVATVAGVDIITAKSGSIRSDASVGIGMNPSHTLDLKTNPAIGFYHSDGTYQGLIGAGTSTVSGGGSYDIGFRANSGYNLLFAAGGSTERMRINSSGRVGIGTTQPDALLHVAADVSTGGVTSTGRVVIEGRPAGFLGDDIASIDFHNTGDRRADIRMERGDTASDSQLVFSTSDAGTLTDRVIIKEDGKVGIGTTSPAVGLQIESSTAETSRSLRLAYDSSYFFDLKQKGAGGISYNAQNPAAGGHRFEIDGSEKVRIAYNGNVGIGTTSPQSLLHLSSGTSGDATLIIESDTDNNNENDNPQLQFKQDGGITIAKAGLTGDAGQIFNNSLANAAYFGNDENASVQLYTNATAALTIREDGDVGIGTTSPSTKLHILQSGTAVPSDGVSSLVVQKSAVAGTSAAINIVSGDSSEASLRFGDTTDQSMGALRYLNDVDAFSIVTNNTDQVRITSNGYVGIKTTSPGQALHVVGNTFSSGAIGNKGVNIGQQLELGTSAVATLRFDADAWRLYAGGAGSSGEVFRVTETGKVGIGTDAPKQNLHISGGSTSGAVTKVIVGATGTNAESHLFLAESFQGDDVNYGYSFVTDGNNTNNLLIKNHNNSTSGNVAISVERASGNVGIGTSSPGTNLDVVGNIRLNTVGNQLEFSNANVALQRDSAHRLEIGGYDGIIFKSSNTTINNQTERMRITSAGNVGIGTTSPSEEFEVVGDAKVTNLGINASADGYLSSLSARLSVGGNVVVNTSNPLLYLRSNNTGNDSDIRYQTALKFTNGSGATHAVINSSGNVGIGTASPDESLHVNGKILVAANDIAYAAGYFTRIKSNYSDNPFVLESRAGTLMSAKDYGRTLAFYAGPDGSTAEVMRVDEDGKVGIGTTTPNYLLDVESAGARARVYNTVGSTSVYLTTPAAQNASLYFGPSTDNEEGGITYRAASSSMAFTTNTSEAMRIDSSGNVGIGTNTPVGKFNSHISATRQLTHNGNGGDLSIISDNNSTPVFYVKGTGTADLVNIFDNTTEVFTILDGGNVGIGTTNPSAKLDVVGFANINDGSSNVMISSGNTAMTGTNNTAVGNQALYNTDAGASNTAIGYQSGYVNTAGNNNALLGRRAGFYSTGSQNVLLGTDAGYGAATSTYSNTVAVGYQALYDLTTGSENTAIGYQALSSLSANTSNTAVGFKALTNSSTGYNTAIGANSILNNASGQRNTGVGWYALADSTGSYNASLGMRAGRYVGGGNVAIGYDAASNTTGSNNVIIGREAGLGVASSSYSSTVAVGYQALYDLTSGAGNTAVGYQASTNIAAGNNNTSVGFQAGYSITSGSSNSFFGTYAGVSTTGSANTAIGHSANFSNTTGANNVAIGRSAGYTNSTGSGNIFIGYQAGYNETGSNKLYIANDDTTTPLIYGEFDNEILNVNGKLKPNSITVDDEGLSAAGDYGPGAEIWYQGTSTVGAGGGYYLDSTGGWTAAKADAAATATGMLAVAAGTDSDVDGMVLRGFVQLSNALSGSVGDPVYLDTTTAGRFTTTKPTGTGNFVRRVGYLAKGTNVIYFNPSNEYEAL